MSFMTTRFDQSTAAGFSMWKPGDRIVGTIVDVKDGVKTKPDEKTGEVYDATILTIDMDPAKSVSHNREMEPIDLSEGGEVAMWLAFNKRSLCKAVQDAVIAAGASDLSVGSTIAIIFSAYGEQSAEAKKKGWNRPKLYEAQYKPAAKSVAVDDLI